MSELFDEPVTYACLACGAAAAPAPDRPNILVCPVCQAESFVPDADEPAADETIEMSREAEIDAARIRRLATERRSINRTASYFIVAAGVCVVAIGQLVFMTIQHVRALGAVAEPRRDLVGALAEDPAVVELELGALAGGPVLELAAFIRRRHPRPDRGVWVPERRARGDRVAQRGDDDTVGLVTGSP